MKKFIPIFLIILAFLNFLAWIAVYDFSQPRFLEINFFDVGQGDSAFISTPGFHQVLIDGGPSFAVLGKLGKEMPFWDRSIDLMILTHPESDHLVGLLEVLKKYRVENILWTGVNRNTAEWREWKKMIEVEKAKITIAESGQKIILPSNFSEPAFLNILYPLEKPGQEFIKDSNNTSIVSRLVFGENSFIFTGDLLLGGEVKIVEKGIDVDSDVLKAGHHGSKTSSGEEFLKEVSPKIVVISAGKDNSYGHPHQEVLERLNKYDIEILRTDLLGDIKIISDGKSIRLKED